MRTLTKNGPAEAEANRAGGDMTWLGEGECVERWGVGLAGGAGAQDEYGPRLAALD